MKVLCIGGVAYDITLPVENFPVENKKVKIDNIVTCGGGSASNVAYLLSKWNIDTFFAGVVGNDYYGNLIKEEFNSVKVNTKYLEIKEDISTPISFIISSKENKTRTIITARNDIKLESKLVKENFDIIYMDGHEEEFSKKAISSSPNAIKVIDAGRCCEETISLCRLSDYIICSLDFAEDYANLNVDFDNLDSLVDIYEILHDNFKGKIIITLGEYGSFTELNGYKLVPGLSVDAVDTSGAGDIYHGAFVYGLINNYDLIKNMKISNIAAGLSTLKIGGRYSIPRYGDVLKKYDELIKK